MNTKLKVLALAAALAVPTAGLTNAQAHHATSGDANATKVKLTGGQTTLRLSDAAKSGIAGAGITAGAISPATYADGTFTLPIAGGKLKSTTTFGFVVHRGGITLTKGDRTVKLRRFTAVSGERGASVWALVAHRHAGSSKHKARASHNARRGIRRHAGRHWRRHVVRLLALANVKRTDSAGKVDLTADAALTKQGAKVLDRRLATTLFTAGQPIGTVAASATTG